MIEIPKVAAVLTPIKSVPATAIDAKQPQKGGNDLPPEVEAAKTQPVNAKEMQENVEAAVKHMNEYIQSTQRDLSFSYDKSSGETVVKVLDRVTQQVIRQMPDETFLKLVRNKDVEGSFQLLNARA